MEKQSKKSYFTTLLTEEYKTARCFKHPEGSKLVLVGKTKIYSHIRNWSGALSDITLADRSPLIS